MPIDWNPTEVWTPPVPGIKEAPADVVTRPDGDNPQTVVEEPAGQPDTKVAEEDKPEAVDGLEEE